MIYNITEVHKKIRHIGVLIFYKVLYDQKSFFYFYKGLHFFNHTVYSLFQNLNVYIFNFYLKITKYQYQEILWSCHISLTDTISSWIRDCQCVADLFSIGTRILIRGKRLALLIFEIVSVNFVSRYCPNAYTLFK